MTSRSTSGARRRTTGSARSPRRSRSSSRSGPCAAASRSSTPPTATTIWSSTTSCRGASCASSTSRSCRRRASSTTDCAGAHWRPPLSSTVADAAVPAPAVRITGCRSCGTALEVFLSLGELPLPDALLDEADLGGPEARYPLDVGFCPGCSLVQILQEVSPEALFVENNHYFSSFSEGLLRHCRAHALNLMAEHQLDAESLVVELASNDGYLLKNFVEHGIPVLGIDPASGPAKAAEKVGVPTLNIFFTRELAQDLRAKGKRADVVIANNVLAHVADTNGFVAGIATLLK